MSNYTEIESLREQIRKDFGRVDILINNAGLIPFASLVDQKASDIERLFKVNVNSPILVGIDMYALLENSQYFKLGGCVLIGISEIQQFYRSKR